MYLCLIKIDLKFLTFVYLKIAKARDWVKSYKVFDHLGSLRVDGVGYGNSEQTYFDYKPFGKAKTRLGYVEMQETPRLF